MITIDFLRDEVQYKDKNEFLQDERSKSNPHGFLISKLFELGELNPDEDYNVYGLEFFFDELPEEDELDLFFQEPFDEIIYIDKDKLTKHMGETTEVEICYINDTPFSIHFISDDSIKSLEERLLFIAIDNEDY